MDPREKKRFKAFEKVLKNYGAPVPDAETIASWGERPPAFANTSDEDVAQLLAEIDAGRELDAYLVVTEGGEGDRTIYYFYPCPTAAAAREKGTENISDGIYRELPRMLVNLDTGVSYSPALEVRWLKD